MTYGVFSHLGTLLYNINMLYSPDAEVKGDTQIMVKGAEGMLHKEMEKQSAMEILQVIGAVGSQLGQSLNLAPVIGWSIKKLLTSFSVPDDVIQAMNQPPMMPMIAPQQRSSGGVSGGNPNSNPNPGLTASSDGDSIAGIGSS